MAKQKKKLFGLSSCVDYPVEDKARMKRYQAEDDLRTMQKADEIRSSAERVKAMRTVANEQLAALKKVAK